MAFNSDSEDSQQGVTKPATRPFGVQPKANSPTRSLLAINAMNGWPDPTKIYDTQNGGSESIGLWDHARTANNDPGLGNIPTNDPPATDSGMRVTKGPGEKPQGLDPSEGPQLGERVSWSHPGSTPGGSAFSKEFGRINSWGGSKVKTGRGES